MSKSTKLVLGFVALFLVVSTVILVRASISSRRALDNASLVIERVVPEIISDVSEDLNEIFLREVEPNTSFHEWVKDNDYEKLMEIVGERTGFYVRDHSRFRSYSRRNMEREVILSTPSPSGDYSDGLWAGHRRVHLLIRLRRRINLFDPSPLLDVIDYGAPQNVLFVDCLGGKLQGRSPDLELIVSQSQP